jgi:hypothetical protein
MKRFICMFFAAILCLSFVGCKEEGGSLPAETEKITPRVEETTIPPTKTPPAPAERQPRGEQKGGGNDSQ